VRQRLGGEIERLRQVAGGVGWVAPENLHITLKFLGRVEEARLGLVQRCLDRAAAGIERFEIAIERLGAFPAPTRPRVIWAGVDQGAEPLSALADRVERELAEMGFAPEARGFTPHVTLGRVGEPRRNPALAAALERAGATMFGAVRVDRLSLMRSDLSPRGARYTELSAHPLGGA
jgi:RNA 2',3'-cyclic 3'-phosphodiesterase